LHDLLEQDAVAYERVIFDTPLLRE
jgi:hypothetical protein